MDSNQIRKELDELIVETVSYDQDALPKRLLEVGKVWLGFSCKFDVYSSMAKVLLPRY